MLSTIVQPPALRKACHGLVESANRPSVTDDKWMNGAKFNGRGCYTLDATEVACPAEDTGDFQVCTPATEFKPYVVHLGLDWATNDPVNPEDVGMQAVEFGLSAKLESLIWSGVVGGANPTLSDGTALTDATDIRSAIGAIEDAFLNSDDLTGGAGTIYLAPSAIVTAGDALFVDGGRLYTKATCSLVVVGNFPAGEVAGHLGDVDLYLSEAQALDTYDERLSNEYNLQYQLFAMVVWNPCGVFTAAVAEEV